MDPHYLLELLKSQVCTQLRNFPTLGEQKKVPRYENSWHEEYCTDLNDSNFS